MKNRFVYSMLSKQSNKFPHHKLRRSAMKLIPKARKGVWVRTSKRNCLNTNMSSLSLSNPLPLSSIVEKLINTYYFELLSNWIVYITCARCIWARTKASTSDRQEHIINIKYNIVNVFLPNKATQSEGRIVARLDKLLYIVSMPCIIFDFCMSACVSQLNFDAVKVTTTR